MNNIVEIGSCEKCGKPCKKEKLLSISEFFCTQEVCKDCYVNYQRSRWGYW